MAFKLRNPFTARAVDKASPALMEREAPGDLESDADGARKSGSVIMHDRASAEDVSSDDEPEVMAAAVIKTKTKSNQSNDRLGEEDGPAGAGGDVDSDGSPDVVQHNESDLEFRQAAGINTTKSNTFSAGGEPSAGDGGGGGGIPEPEESNLNLSKSDISLGRNTGSSTTGTIDTSLKRTGGEAPAGDGDPDMAGDEGLRKNISINLRGGESDGPADVFQNNESDLEFRQAGKTHDVKTNESSREPAAHDGGGGGGGGALDRNVTGRPHSSDITLGRTSGDGAAGDGEPEPVETSNLNLSKSDISLGRDSGPITRGTVGDITIKRTGGEAPAGDDDPGGPSEMEKGTVKFFNEKKEMAHGADDAQARGPVRLDPTPARATGEDGGGAPEAAINTSHSNIKNMSATDPDSDGDGDALRHDTVKNSIGNIRRETAPSDVDGEGPPAAATEGPGGGDDSPAAMATNLNSSRSNVYRAADPASGSGEESPLATTVKSGKSNSSDRVSGDPTNDDTDADDIPDRVGVRGWDPEKSTPIAGSAAGAGDMEKSGPLASDGSGMSRTGSPVSEDATRSLPRTEVARAGPRADDDADQSRQFQTLSNASKEGPRADDGMTRSGDAVAADGDSPDATTIGHEAAHTVQQSGAARVFPETNNLDDAPGAAGSAGDTSPEDLRANWTSSNPGIATGKAVGEKGRGEQVAADDGGATHEDDSQSSDARTGGWNIKEQKGARTGGAAADAGEPGGAGGGIDEPGMATNLDSSRSKFYSTRDGEFHARTDGDPDFDTRSSMAGEHLRSPGDAQRVSLHGLPPGEPVTGATVTNEGRDRIRVSDDGGPQVAAAGSVQSPRDAASGMATGNAVGEKDHGEQLTADDGGVTREDDSQSSEARKRITLSEDKREAGSDTSQEATGRSIPENSVEGSVPDADAAALPDSNNTEGVLSTRAVSGTPLAAAMSSNAEGSKGVATALTPGTTSLAQDGDAETGDQLFSPKEYTLKKQEEKEVEAKAALDIDDDGDSGPAAAASTIDSTESQTFRTDGDPDFDTRANTSGGAGYKEGLIKDTFPPSSGGKPAGIAIGDTREDGNPDRVNVPQGSTTGDTREDGNIAQEEEARFAKIEMDYKGREAGSGAEASIEGSPKTPTIMRPADQGAGGGGGGGAAGADSDGEAALGDVRANWTSSAPAIATDKAVGGKDHGSQVAESSDDSSAIGEEGVQRMSGKIALVREQDPGTADDSIHVSDDGGPQVAAVGEQKKWLPANFRTAAADPDDDGPSTLLDLSAVDDSGAVPAIGDPDFDLATAAGDLDSDSDADGVDVDPDTDADAVDFKEALILD